MSVIVASVFWICASLIVYAYALYPIVIWCLSRWFAADVVFSRSSRGQMDAIPKSGDSDSAIRPVPEARCDKKVEDRRSAFNFAGKIHLHVTVPGES